MSDAVIVSVARTPIGKANKGSLIGVDAFRLADQTDFRTYTAPQMDELLTSVAAWEVAATYDFAYQIDQPVEVGPRTEDVVYVLRRR